MIRRQAEVIEHDVRVRDREIARIDLLHEMRRRGAPSRS